ncbi:molecular chaperone HtpG [Entomospira culicis]|uniref:Chaperone protein HtpG n=1 Tax=Entomospira culicis TaxID=2719989 RepID=A0A968KWT8_9SPIO|nr:molecular chaperone HtpG [Entomospira culicis]NIZ19473.1 molecular chaperone HtpG [Entomospira culicis]NIZ69622.1 molecular chaperone HtpG [Entomospira culicis]WDI36733.1 molecular chaperone HtpG [Entomospira culicis]WDI38362.1 molecular chaperone HtpG [Entomospira culicis]
MAKKEFKAEVDKLLKLIIHSLYSHNEIFLRELISNAGDALDKMKFLNLTDEAFKHEQFEGRIDIYLNEKEKSLIISDNGIGMDENDLNENLGKIAHSGTKLFAEKLTGDAQKDSNLIGQFGVGFYSVFMVAHNVEVISRKAGSDKAFKWTSDGQSGYTVEDAQRDAHGTTIICHLNDEHVEYAQQYRVTSLIEKYSNFIAFPIFLHYEEQEYTPEGEEPKPATMVEKQANSAKAIWKRSKSELSQEEYNDFYQTLSGESEEPLFHMHTQAEGSLEYTTLFYIPAKAPYDLYRADYRPGVKLYVKRVFITDDDKELLPIYLRFIRGVIDSEDLPLNVSREILQQNRILTNIKGASVKKILTEIKKLASDNPTKFEQFVEHYNRPMKEGLYSDFVNKADLLEIVRFKSTNDESAWTSLAQYKERMNSEQKSIYYLCGDNAEAVRHNPLVQAYKKRGFEVLLLSDEMDQMVMPMVQDYQGIALKAINKADADDGIFDDAKDEEAIQAVEGVAEKLKEALGDRVKEVRLSARLDDAPSAVVSSDDDMSLQMSRMFQMMGQEAPEVQPILEINPKHALVQSVAKSEDKELIADYAILLLDGAYLAEGAPLKEPARFSQLMFKYIK